VPSKHLLGEKRMKMRNLYGDHDGQLGIVTMNKEHRYNMLTDGMIADITRGLDSMNQNHHAHAIYFSTEKGEHFSNGTDFKTIAHMKKEDAYGRIQKYMEELYHM
jgi:enoyl-CoA hydratase/carnithine racemase